MTLIKWAAELARSGKIDGIILANRWATAEYSPEYLKSVGAFWSTVPVPVLMFTPMPEFTQFDRQIVRRAWNGDGGNDFEYDKEVLSLSEARVTAMAQANGFTVLNTADLFCGGDRDHCSVIRGGRSLLIDYGHLTEDGARLLGSRIAASPVWQHWLEQVREDAAAKAELAKKVSKR